MKRLFVGALAVALLAAGGCIWSNSGGTGKADSFTLAGPPRTTALKQGETQTVKITVQRGTDFKQAVKLTADKPPQGVKVEFIPADVKPGDREAEMKITADKDAAVGEHAIVVKGAPESGSGQSVDVKVKVEEAKK
jgi:uncharacterized membrane protein